MTNIETIVHGNISFALKQLMIYKIHIGIEVYNWK